jgi:hypothetical protein
MLTASRQTLVNLAAAAWVGTLIISAYYVFSVLSTIS